MIDYCNDDPIEIYLARDMRSERARADYNALMRSTLIKMAQIKKAEMKKQPATKKVYFTT